jgi:peroxin-14
MLDRNKDAQATILNDLQTEVKSLKSLLISRRPVSSATTLLDQASSGTGSVTSPSAETNGISPRLPASFNSSSRPGIPSWQMAAKNAAAETKTPATSVEDAANTTTAASTDSNTEAKDQ